MRGRGEQRLGTIRGLTAASQRRTRSAVGTTTMILTHGLRVTKSLSNLITCHLKTQSGHWTYFSPVSWVGIASN